MILVKDLSYIKRVYDLYELHKNNKYDFNIKYFEILNDYIEYCNSDTFENRKIALEL